MMSAMDVLQGSEGAGVMAGSRYPRRDRNTTLRPDSLQGSRQTASSSKDQEEEDSGSEQVLLQLLHWSHVLTWWYGLGNTMHFISIPFDVSSWKDDQSS